MRNELPEFYGLAPDMRRMPGMGFFYSVVMVYQFSIGDHFVSDNPYTPPASAQKSEGKIINKTSYAIGTVCILLAIFLALGLFSIIPKIVYSLILVLRNSIPDPGAKAEVLGQWLAIVVFTFLAIFMFKYGQSKIKSSKE